MTGWLGVRFHSRAGTYFFIFQALAVWRQFKSPVSQNIRLSLQEMGAEMRPHLIFFISAYSGAAGHDGLAGCWISQPGRNRPLQLLDNLPNLHIQEHEHYQ
jgi:hypothetical protein